MTNTIVSAASTNAMSHHDCDRVVNANADTRLKIDRTAIASMKNS